jgi:hypothetical protein
MQRLFSAFPNSLPGAGLLLLRFCQSTLLIHHAGVLSGLSLSTEGLVKLFATGAGGLILLGLFTPFVSTIGAAAALWMAIPLENESCWDRSRFARARSMVNRRASLWKKAYRFRYKLGAFERSMRVTRDLDGGVERVWRANSPAQAIGMPSSLAREDTLPYRRRVG